MEERTLEIIEAEKNANTLSSPELAQAFAIVGKLIEAQVIPINMLDRDWVDEFEAAVFTVAKALRGGRP